MPYRLMFFLLLIAVIFALVTFVLRRAKFRWVKYLPGMVSFLIGTYQLYLSKYGYNEGLQDIARLITAWMMYTGTIASVVMGIIVDGVFTKRRK